MDAHGASARQRKGPKLAIAKALVVLFGIHVLGAQTKGNLTPSMVYARSKASVVTIVTFDANGAPLKQGSGFIVAKDRILTNYHVLLGGSSASVTFDGGSEVTTRMAGPETADEDCAILVAETGNRPSLPWGNVLQLKVGDVIYAIGAPSGLESSFSNGIISAFRKDRRDRFYVQITASIAPGSSGGPLLNNQGEVVGITTSRLENSGFGLAIELPDLQPILESSMPAVSLSALDDFASITKAPEKLDSASPADIMPSIAYLRYLLGWAYETGIGEPQDFAQAASWYRKAADLGSGEGECSLGFLYDQGRGVPQDTSRATDLYLRAATLGSPDAQYFASGAYLRGTGVRQDFTQSLFWADVALLGKQVRSSPEDAARIRDSAASHLNGLVVLQTEERAQKWQQEHNNPKIPGLLPRAAPK